MNLTKGFIAMALAVAGCTAEIGSDQGPNDYLEWDIAALQASMNDGELSARELVDFYLERIATIDHAGPELRSVIEINEDAREIADALECGDSPGVRGCHPDVID